MDGIVFDIKEFAIYDGPGIRTTVFFKGCPLHCCWCHNPEGISFEIEKIDTPNSARVIGRKYSSKELIEILLSHNDIFAESGGGVTFSGGEPLSQPQFLSEVMQGLAGVNLAVDTSGYADEKSFMNIVEKADLILFDLKIMDPVQHVKKTGVDNALIHRNLMNLDRSGKEYIVRVPLIPGVTDTGSNYAAMAEFLSRLSNLALLELMPYNYMAGGKYKGMGLAFEPGFNEKAEVNRNIRPFDDLPTRVILHAD